MRGRHRREKTDGQSERKRESEGRRARHKGEEIKWE